MSRMRDVRIGISGWTYAPWRKVFYPEKLPQHRELEFASRQLRSIEINGSFYSLQRPQSYLKWHSATPDDFIFSVKGGRHITHMRKLREIDGPLANFFASGVLALGEKLGPILWQFPASFNYDYDRFECFFEKLPHTMSEASKVASGHDRWMNDRAFVIPEVDGRIKHAVEVRSETFRNSRFIDSLKRHELALVVSHSTDEWPMFEEMTADFMYARLHGEGQLYSGGYGAKALDEWAVKVKSWKRRHDVYFYFDNDAKVRAPFDARALVERLTPQRQARAA